MSTSRRTVRSKENIAVMNEGLTQNPSSTETSNSHHNMELSEPNFGYRSTSTRFQDYVGTSIKANRPVTAGIV